MGYKWRGWLKAQHRTVTPAGDCGGTVKPTPWQIPSKWPQTVEETGNASHHLTGGWRAKCKQGYSSLASLCLPAETQQLLQHPKGYCNAPAFSRTQHACCRLMFSTKSLSRWILESIQGAYAADQILSPVSCVLPGGTGNAIQTHC